MGKASAIVLSSRDKDATVATLTYGKANTLTVVLTNDYKSSTRDIVEFYNLRGGKERIFDDMNNGFGWSRLPKSFMAENTVFLLLTAFSPCFSDTQFLQDHHEQA